MGLTRIDFLDPIDRLPFDLSLLQKRNCDNPDALNVIATSGLVSKLSPLLGLISDHVVFLVDL